MFIPQTRFRKISTNEDIARFNGIVRDINSVFQAIPANQRPPLSERGDYELKYDLRCSMHIRALGVRDDGIAHLIVVYDVWTTPASRLADDPPAFRNSHLFAKPKATMDMRQYLRSNIREAIERATLANRLGDQRDLRLKPTQNDPTGFWDDPEVVGTRNLILDVDTTISNPSSASLRTNPETGE